MEGARKAVSIDEVSAMILRIRRIRDRWKGNPGYLRTLDIELAALYELSARIVRDGPMAMELTC